MRVTLGNCSNATVNIATPSATANITDHDSDTAELSVTTQGDETGPQAIDYTVTPSKQNDPAAAIPFDITSTGGSATSGSDYTAIPAGTKISVAAGASTGTYSLPVTNEDRKSVV